VFGTAEKVTVSKDETTIVGGGGKKEDVDARIAQIRKEIEATDSDYDREKLQERLAKLAGGVAVIKVGAATEVEAKERKHRIEDAVRNAKAAVEEGLVPGGGVALIEAAKGVEGMVEDLSGDEKTGAQIVMKSVSAPIKQIAENCGVSGDVVANKVLSLPKGEGYNADNGKYEDLLAAGVADPVKVTRSALQNASSIAGLFLTTEAVVANKPEPKTAAPQPQGMDY
ncbi:MAG: chaperonin GroEL, partial [Aeriscardovia sp.]|nr:chaperonin GroEL [Aeriscardovia sp.]